MNLLLRSTCLVLVPLALTACDGGDKRQEARTAQGEILPGSASDAMLPLDTVRSQPPLAPPEEATGKGGKRASGETENGNGRGEASEGSRASGLAPGPSIAAEPVQ
jgi:hypothetical protein